MRKKGVLMEERMRKVERVKRMVENSGNIRGRVVDLRVAVEFEVVARERKSCGEGGG